jgi:hypothetical protein
MENVYIRGSRTNQKRKVKRGAEREKKKHWQVSLAEKG